MVENGGGGPAAQQIPPPQDSPVANETSGVTGLGTSCSSLSTSKKKGTDNLGKQKSFWMMGLDGDEPIRFHEVLLILFVCIVPNILVIVLLSDLGLGVDVYNRISPASVSLAGDACCLLAATSFVVLYVSDWVYWSSICWKVVWAVIPVLMVTAGAFLKGRSYPWAPILFILFLIPVSIGAMRASICKSTAKSKFYKAVSFSLMVCAIGSLAVWLVWMSDESHTWNRTNKDALAARMKELYENVHKDMALNYTQFCHPNLKDTSQLTTEEKEEVTTACQAAASVWFLIYLAPFVCTICDFVVSVFCFINGVSLAQKDSNNVVRAMKHFMIWLVFIIGGMYCSASFFSVSMTSTFISFFAAALLVLLAWMVLEMGTQEIEKVLSGSRFATLLWKAWRSDWVRAMAVVAINFFIPVYFFLNSLNQKVRIYRGTAGPNPGRFTDRAQRVLEELDKWNWCSILTKVAILCELFFTFQVGFTKATYVFLSWLTRQLATIDFVVVCCMVFGVGFIMFLMPPVPGVPVYVFSGIVISDVGSKKLSGSGDTPFILGIIIACCVSFVCKLVACTCQYMIGFFLGKKVKVQQLIKVDSVPTRAVEMILKRPGLDLGKVAILIGGPDWPVSVTCGILCLNIPQMLLGTMPVILILSPCCLAGAFISRQGMGGEDSIWPMLANFASVIAFAGQMVALVLAGALTVKVIQESSDELSVERPEHAAVAELTKQEEEATRMYAEITKWENMGFGDKFLIISMTATQLLSGIIFVFGASMCFLPFSVDKDIDAPVAEGGLGGDPLAIVKPLGWLACGIFFYGVVTHILHLKIMGRRAKAKLRYQPQPLVQEEKMSLSQHAAKTEKE